MREALAEEKFLPLIEEARAKLKRQEQKTRVLVEQLKALVGLFKQKEDAWAERLERLRKGHARELRRRERELGSYKHLLEDREAEVKGLLGGLGAAETEESRARDAGKPEAKAPRKKRAKKRVKLGKTVRKPKPGKAQKERERLRAQEERLESIRRTVDLIKREFEPNC